MNRVQITQNFYLDEFTRSQTAARHGIEIVIAPGSDVFHNVERLCTEILQPIRDHLGPVTISSGYRPPEVNRLTGGSRTSAHLQGLAADFTVSGMTPLELARWIAYRRGAFGAAKGVPLYFDQCIHEFGQWVHVGLAPLHQPPRLQLLTAFKKPAPIAPSRPQTVYAQGIHPIADLT